MKHEEKHEQVNGNITQADQPVPLRQAGLESHRFYNDEHDPQIGRGCRSHGGVPHEEARETPP